MPIFHGNTIGQGVVLNTPSADGTAGQVITTDGSGNLSFGIAFVTPEQYGAVGDGVADDTTAIQDAVTALTAGQALVFQAGATYLVSANVTKSSVDDLVIVADGATIYTTDMSLTGVFTFTSCDRLTWRGGHFLGTEDNTYFQANSPSEERSFIYLNTCENAIVSDIRGEAKRRLLTALDCHQLKIDKYQMTGFFAAFSGSGIANGNNAPAVCIRGCDYVQVSNGFAHNHGSILLGQLSGVNVNVVNMTGHDLYDNGVYCSSGFGWIISNVIVRACTGNAVQTRGSMMTVSNVVGDDIPNDYVVDMTTVDGSEGYGITVSNVVSRQCKGALNIPSQNGFFCRGITASNINAYDSLQTGLSGPVVIISTGDVTISNVVVRTTTSDLGILLGGLNAETPCVGLVVTGVDVSDVNGANLSTRGAIRVQYGNEISISGCRFSDINCNIGIRIATCAGGAIFGNVFEGQKVVQAPTGENNTGLIIIGNRGASILCDAAIVGDNYATVNGYPATSTTPLAIGQRTFSGGVGYIATGTASSADWKQITA